MLEVLSWATLVVIVVNAVFVVLMTGLSVVAFFVERLTTRPFCRSVESQMGFPDERDNITRR